MQLPLQKIVNCLPKISLTPWKKWAWLRDCLS